MQNLLFISIIYSKSNFTTIYINITIIFYFDTKIKIYNYRKCYRKYKWEFFFQMCDMQFYVQNSQEKFLSALQSRTSSQTSKVQAPKI